MGQSAALRAALPPLLSPHGIGRRLHMVSTGYPASDLARPSAASALSLLHSRCRTAADSAAGQRKPLLTPAHLDAWAEGSGVRRHAHSRPSSEPYELSTIRELGGGAAMPDGWSSRLVSATGLKPRDGPNQDAFSYTLLEGDWIVCVACDGHGEEGDIIAERVARTIPFFLSSHMPTLGPERSLVRSFQDSQEDLEACLNGAQTFSGTTASAVCIHMDTCETWLAVAGDSKITLGDLASGEMVFVTGGHKAHDLPEADRLRECGAQVITKDYGDGDLVSRVFVPGTGVPGLAMSRSLGDGCLKKYGVIATPHVQNVTEHWTACEAPVAVLASDGLWDTITAKETIESLAARYRAGLDVQRGAEVLLRRSQKLWIQFEGDYCDDVTIVLLAPTESLKSKKVTLDKPLRPSVAPSGPTH
mmetsp:Transcript_24638/g.82478  ORF Transcript_24638/g.82478 Transcript_24638/m.82478 type:complete len:417 (+) Transcript_24638:168-1418(+)